MNRLVASIRPLARTHLATAARAGVARPPVVSQRWFGAAAGLLDRSEVTERVISVLKNFEKVDPKKVTPESHFVNDLGLDSLDTVEVVMAFEEEFVIEIPDAEAEKIQSCKDAIEFIATHPQAK